jgi:hypothetical protein
MFRSSKEAWEEKTDVVGWEEKTVEVDCD